MAIVVGDVSDPAVLARAIDAAVSKFGAIDSVVANAGVLDPVDAVAHANVDEWKKLYEINFFSVVSLVSQALPHLKKSHGRVVAVSSGASVNPYYGWAAYGSSKAALNHFILLVAAENDDILAISIAPGVVDSAMQKDIREKFGSRMTPESLQKFLDLHEKGQLVQPEVVAEIYTNLAVEGWSKDINGKYLRYNDAVLANYSK